MKLNNRTFQFSYVYKLFLTNLIFLMFHGFVNAQNPYIQSILNEISIDSLMDQAEKISGEKEVIVNGNSDTIYSRHKTRPGNELAFQYIIQEFERYGLISDSMIFSSTGKNALAIQTGSVYPDKYYILCGHYDDMPNLPVAPAADDDGSGTAAVLEAARVLSAYQFEYTIVYALWDEEEQGLVGSNAYSDAALLNGDSLMGVINMDAIAWDGNNDSAAMVHTRPVGSSLRLSDTVVSVNSQYGINLNLAVTNPGATYSDHASFWSNDFGAILIIEDWTFDPNPYYHTDQDVVAYFNVPYFERLSKLSIASLAALAVPVGLAGENEMVREPEMKVYPNPAGENVYVRLPENHSGLLEIYDGAGRKIYSSVNENNQTLNLDVSRWISGIYFIRFVSDDFRVSRKFIKR